jgi:hypothetical protein
MSFTLVAVVAGFLIALLLGGRPRHLAGRGFRWWALLPLGLALQVVLERKGFPAAFAFLVVSYVLLLAFCAVNLRLRGMWLIGLGFALNALVIVLDHGMPVAPAAIHALHASPTIHQVKHHLAVPSDRLMSLADVIPVPGLRQVLSFGDMILSIGVVDLLYNLMSADRAGHLARADADEPALRGARLAGRVGDAQASEA